jgi:hypothetical protein
MVSRIIADAILAVVIYSIVSTAIYTYRIKQIVKKISEDIENGEIFMRTVTITEKKEGEQA